MLTDFLMNHQLLFLIAVSNIGAFIFYFGLYTYFSKHYYQSQFASKAQWKCQPDKLNPKEIILRDLRLGSSILLMLSTLSAFFYYYVVLGNYTKIYFHFSDHSLFYFIFSSIFLLLWIDINLYLAHRTLHIPFLFKKIHRLHHRTTSPNAINTFAMHPLEALFYQVVTFIPFLIMPFHIAAIIVILVYTNIVSLIDHSGIKFHSIFFWQSPSLFHDDHHKYFHVNFGQTCWYWDWIFGSWRRVGETHGPLDFTYTKGFNIFFDRSDYVDYSAATEQHSDSSS